MAHPDLAVGTKQQQKKNVRNVPLVMEALVSSPRALFSRTSPTVLVATATWTTSSARRRRAAPVKAAAAEPAGEEKPKAAAAGDGSASPAPKKILKKKPVYSSKTR